MQEQTRFEKSFSLGQFSMFELKLISTLWT